MNFTQILGVRIHATSYEDATRRIIDWAKEGQSRMVCAANVHMIMEAHDNPGFKVVLNNAELVTPDGIPLLWMLRRMGAHIQNRGYGPNLMLHVLSAAKDAGIPVGFYGGKPEVLEELVDKMQEQFPGLQVVYTSSPPFTSKTQGEGERVISEINLAKPRILFLVLGSPKQERWMAQHLGKVSAVMLGVGATFDFLAGAKKTAPGWMQRMGLDWLFRQIRKPMRLWKRYLIHNPRFVWLAFLQLMGLRLF